MSEQKLIGFDDLNLRFFQTLQIIPNNSDSSNTCFECVLVGALENEALIVTVPESNIFPKVTEGQKLVIRAYTSKGVALFPTTILFIAEVPTFMVYLDFPQQITFKQLRKDTRVEATFPVLVNNLTRGIQGITGRIVDLSLSGAQIELFEPAGEAGDNIAVKGKFAVSSIQRKLTLDAKIMSCQKNKKGHQSIGVRFGERNEEDKLILLGIASHAVLSGNEKAIT